MELTEIMNQVDFKIKNKIIQKYIINITQVDLTDAYKISYPSTKEYTFYFAPQGTFCQTDHLLRHKASLNRYKKVETTPSVPSE